MLPAIIFRFCIMKYTDSRGFTLLELLVVIAIVALLATIAFAALDNARIKARDVTRLSDMRVVRQALELYYDDFSKYPGPVSLWGENTACSGWDSSGVDDNSNGKFWLEPLSDLGYIIDVPVDPINTGGCVAPSYAYAQYAAGTYGCDISRGRWYILGVRDMEGSDRPHPDSPGFSCSGRDWQLEFDWVTGAFPN